MTPDEKNALLQFMGTVYGEQKKQDEMLVGQSTNLRPTSDGVKETFDRTLKTPTINEPPRQIQQAPVQNPQQTTPAPSEGPAVAPGPVSVEQATRELAEIAATPIQEEVIQQPVTQEVVDVDPNQFEFDFSEPGKVDKLIELAEKQAKGIDRVNDSLRELIKLQQLLIQSSKVKLTSNGSRPKNNKS